MPGRKKQFIDKKSAVTFHLVHRSQRDPLQASDEASQRVLLETKSKTEPSTKHLDEQRKFGVFFEDDYDYLQHLRDVQEVYDFSAATETFHIERRDGDHAHQSSTDGRQKTVSISEHGRLTLPSSVFASECETEVGMLNKAAPISGPRIDWDPDIVATLDDDFDFDDPENELDDDFVVMANADPDSDDEDSSDEEGSDVDSDKAVMSDDDGRFDDAEEKPTKSVIFPEDMFGDEETKSRFTEYSMTSSVMPRSEGLVTLDDRFEKIFEQYDDMEIGALDEDDIEGNMQQTSHVLDAIIEEFEKTQNQIKLKDIIEKGDINDIQDSDSEAEEDLVKMIIEPQEKQWDCESILSTYSNLYNHPRLIEEPKKIPLTSKLGIPQGVLSSPGLTQKQVEQDIRESRQFDKASTYRPKDENAEERKSRKQAIKEERKERRVEKKANKAAFKHEELRQTKENLNLSKNLQGMKIS